MNVILFAHSQISAKAYPIIGEHLEHLYIFDTVSDGELIAFGAVRTCYSPLKPSELYTAEGEKYFSQAATDGEGGTEMDRLMRTIRKSKHTSTMEHISFTFIIEGVSRSLLAQLTRHRVGFSYSVQSQRYVKFSTESKSGGFDYVKPHALEFENPAFKTYDEAKRIKEHNRLVQANEYFEQCMDQMQETYDNLIKLGINQEDARAVLPNAASVNLFMTCNITSLMGFYTKRKKGRGAQAEITELAEAFRREVLEVEPWLEKYFDEV